eukprot:m.264840 g.264840  ORF g.264840 m.264840 type:complete len:345 (-) comp16233_c0_seq28:3989-5023(-)
MSVYPGIIKHSALWNWTCRAHRIGRIFRSVKPLHTNRQERDSSDNRHLPIVDLKTEKRRKAIHMLVSNYTAPALAAALLDREAALAKCAQLLQDENTEELQFVLLRYQLASLNSNTPPENWVPSELTSDIRKRLAKLLTRLPREYKGLEQIKERRASVLLTLCHFYGEPSVLFTRRSEELGRHAGEICFPGGMVDDNDQHITDTAAREMEEEVGIDSSTIEMLGVLRCDWAELTAITGVAVTPVVGYLPTDVQELDFSINKSEVDHWFTVSLTDLANDKNWVRKKYVTPVFHGGPHIIWGLTAYILDRFVRKAMRRAMPAGDTSPGLHDDAVRSVLSGLVQDTT